MISFPVGSSARNLGFIFDSDMPFSNQINSLSKSCHYHIREHSSNSSSFSSFCSQSTYKFTCLRQTCLLRFTLIWHLTSKSQQTSTHSKLISTRHHKHFKISTHHTNTKKTTLASQQTKNRLQTLSSHIYKTLTNQQPTYLYNSLSFTSQTVSTRSSDSLVLSILYVRSSLGKRAFSVIGPRL